MPTSVIAPSAGRAEGISSHGRRRRRLLVGFAVAAVALVAVSVLSLMVGARTIAPADVLDALFHYRPGDPEHLVVIGSRLPRTLLGLAAGLALGLSGTVMQGLSRNPLADPGILGVNFGASLAVVVAIAYLGVTSASGYVWFAFAGAALASALVYAVSSAGREGATPIKLAIAGAAVSAALGSLITAVLLTSRVSLDAMRFWQVGALAGRTFDVFWQVLPTLVVGAVIALGLGRVLNGLALGDDVARGLGQRGDGGLRRRVDIRHRETDRDTGVAGRRRAAVQQHLRRRAGRVTGVGRQHRQVVGGVELGEAEHVAVQRERGGEVGDGHGDAGDATGHAVSVARARR